MNSGLAMFLAFAIGGVAGLRSMTAPAVVAWAAYSGWINIHGSPVEFMGSVWAVGILTLMAAGEFVADKLPSTPSRTAPLGLGARFVTGALSGACLAVAGDASLWLGALAGAAGGIAGAFAGHRARAGLVRAFHVRDFVIAVAEDLFAIGLGFFVASRF
jgi:uncharacterized membrane protein